LASGYWLLLIYMRIYFKNRPMASAGDEHTGSPLHIRRKREASLSSLVVTSRVMSVGL